MCPLLKISFGNPYLKILDLSKHFIADAPMKRRKKLVQQFEIWVQEPLIAKSVNMSGSDIRPGLILFVQEVVTLQKKHLIYLHQKMRFTPFINYYDTLE